MSSTLVTGIGELVTCDGRPRPLGHPPRRRRGRRGRACAWLGPAAAAPAADRQVDVGGRAVIPASSTRTPTWSSPATGATSSPPGWPAPPTTAAASPHGRRDPVRDRRRAARPRRPAHRRDARPGHDDRGGQERLRADRRRRGPGAAHRPRVHRETTFLGAHVVPARVRRRPRGIPRPRHRADARGRGPARQVDRRLLRAALGARVHRGRGAGRAGGGPRRRARAAGARQPARPRTRASSSRWSSARQRRPLHVPVGRRRRRAGRRSDTTWRPCCREWSSRPARPTRTPRRCCVPASRSRWPPTATRAPATRRRCRSSSPWRCGRWA